MRPPRWRTGSPGRERVAAWAVNEPEIAVAVIGALLAGVPITPINPKAGERELAHILADSDPELLLCPPGTDVPAAAAARERVDVDLGARGGELPPEPDERAGDRRLHVRHHRAAQGRRAAAPRDRLQPRRARRGVGVDGRRRRRRTRCRSSTCTG